MSEFFVNTWKSSVANKAMLIGSGILLLAIVGLLVFVLINRLRGGAATGDEGFMVDKKGNSLHWSKEAAPVTAAFDPDFPEEYIMIYRMVASEVNKFIGKEVLDPFGMVWEHPKAMETVKDLPFGHMYLTLADPDVEHHGASNEYRYDDAGELKGCLIKVSPGLEGETLKTSMRHEVGGHGLGLDHDRLEHSVMFAIAGKRAKDFTDADKERLKEVYG